MGYTINRREEGGHDLEGCMVREYQYIQRYVPPPRKEHGGCVGCVMCLHQ